MTIERAEREVQRAFERACACVRTSERGTLSAVEATLWSALLALGRALIAEFLARTAAQPQTVSYSHEGRQYVLSGTRRDEIGTRFGKVPFTRPVGRAAGVKMDRPVDRALGLCSRFSLGTVSAVVQLCTLMAFATARRTFAQFHEWSPSTRATLRMVDALGARARGFLDHAAAAEQDGEVLVIEVDGKGAPMIHPREYERRRRPRRARADNKRHGRRRRRREHPKPRRKKGDKSKNAKVAFVGVIYTLRKTKRGMEGPINKRLIATFESHEALFRWLRKHAVQRGYGKKRCLFLADGSEHIWRNQQRYFPDAEVCIDWYHIVEKLWEAGGCFFAEGSDALSRWFAEQQRRLRRGQVDLLLDDLGDRFLQIAKTGPGNKGRRKRLGDIIAHLTEHRERMGYARLRRDDLVIGTGAVEGAVRNLVGMRLDGPGMRWSRDRAEMVLHLRCIHLNGQWDAFHDYLAARPFKLAAQPVPTRPHDAKPQQLREAA
jgi:hypothetical protein